MDRIDYDQRAAQLESIIKAKGGNLVQWHVKGWDELSGTLQDDFGLDRDVRFFIRATLWIGQRHISGTSLIRNHLITANTFSTLADHARWEIGRSFGFMLIGNR